MKTKKTRRQKERSSFRILLVIETSRAYGRGVVEGVSKYAYEQGNWFIHFQDRGLIEKIPNSLMHWNGDGIITRTSSKKLDQMIRKKEIPFVELFGTDIPEVCCDEALVGRMAAEHFLERGLTHFGYFSIGSPNWSQRRGDSFDYGLRLYGHRLHRFKIKRPSRALLPVWDTSHDDELIDWLKNLPKPIGIFCAADIHAITIQEYCRQLEIAVPEEVAVLGTDNDKTLCHVANPNISSIDLNSPQIGYTAAHLLHRRMLNPDAELKTPILIPPSFIETRQSTDTIAIDDPDVAQAIRFIRERATRQITVTDVADHVALSQPTLFRRFRRYLGHSPEREIIRVRINRAKILLLETNLPLSVIAAKTGFMPPEYFFRVFKRECGVTPQNYRNMTSMNIE